MENRSSFGLNGMIQRWREELARSPAIRSENLDELESHLRDSIAALESRGLSAAEAFLIATRRIGKGTSLGMEFGKVNGTVVWLDRILWMLIGVQVWGFISGATGLIASNALLFGLRGAGYDFKTQGFVVTVTLIALLNLAGFAGSLALCWWLFCRKGQQLGLWLERLLRGRATWALTFGGLYLLSLSINLIRWGTQSLVVTSLGKEQVGGFYYSMGVSNAITFLITPVVFVGLTLFLARKRFQLTSARDIQEAETL
jgi:hypothetical protein